MVKKLAAQRKLCTQLEVVVDINITYICGKDPDGFPLGWLD